MSQLQPPPYDSVVKSSGHLVAASATQTGVALERLLQRADVQGAAQWITNIDEAGLPHDFGARVEAARAVSALYARSSYTSLDKRPALQRLLHFIDTLSIENDAGRPLGPWYLTQLCTTIIDEFPRLVAEEHQLTDTNHTIKGLPGGLEPRYASDVGRVPMLASLQWPLRWGAEDNRVWLYRPSELGDLATARWIAMAWVSLLIPLKDRLRNYVAHTLPPLPTDLATEFAAVGADALVCLDSLYPTREWPAELPEFTRPGKIGDITPANPGDYTDDEPAKAFVKSALGWIDKPNSDVSYDRCLALPYELELTPTVRTFLALRRARFLDQAIGDVVQQRTARWNDWRAAAADDELTEDLRKARAWLAGEWYSADSLLMAVQAMACGVPELQLRNLRDRLWPAP